MSMLPACTRLTCLLSRSLSLCFRLLSRSRLLCLRLPCQRQRSARERGRGERWNLLHGLLSTAAAQRPDALLSFLPSPSANNKVWYNLLKRPLGTHLGHAAQSNDGATKRHQSEGPDPPSNSRHHPKRQNIHPHCYLLSAPFSCLSLDYRVP